MNARKRSFLSPFVIALGVASLAPTVGDIGSCSAPSAPLDASRFFEARASAVCDRCGACSLHTQACKLACDVHATLPSAFPRGCAPAVHDGEVCIRAIGALSCTGAYDLVGEPPIAPTECDFCPAQDQGPTP